MTAQPIVLSASSVATFMRCEQQWYYAYIERIKRPPSVRQTLGIAAHSSVEADMGQKIESRIDLPESEMIDVFSDEWDRMAPDIEAPEENLGKAKDSGVNVVRIYRRIVAPTIQPVMVEQEGQIEVDGVPYSGYIDLVDDQGIVRDTKTTGRKPYDINLQYVMAMAGYALTYRMISERIEKGISLDYLVRTKTPYYHQVASNRPIDDGAIEVFAKVLDDIYARIQAGRFIPNGIVHNACGWCGYREICPAFRRFGDKERMRATNS